MKVKSTVSSNVTLAGMAVVNKQTDEPQMAGVGAGVENLEPSDLAGGRQTSRPL